MSKERIERWTLWVLAVGILAISSPDRPLESRATRIRFLFHHVWGGKPTVAKLRHSNPTLNLHTRARYHEKAAQLLRKDIPTLQEERADREC